MYMCYVLNRSPYACVYVCMYVYTYIRMYVYRWMENVAAEERRQAVMRRILTRMVQRGVSLALDRFKLG